jgi:hypothetical protein
MGFSGRFFGRFRPVGLPTMVNPGAYFKTALLNRGPRRCRWILQLFAENREISEAKGVG